MPIETLEEIRLLSNLETLQNKLLQIVLFGQPELDQRISNKEIRQLKERITYSFNLNPLKQDEIRDYLNTRLRACGYRANDAFDKSSVRAINRYSNGLLRRINILADKAMLAAFAANKHKVTAKHVHIAARDSEFIGTLQRYRFAALVVAALIVLLLAGWLLPINSILEQYKHAVPAAVSTADDVTKVEKVPVEKLPATIYLPQDGSRYYDYLSPGDPELEHYVVKSADKNMSLDKLESASTPDEDTDTQIPDSKTGQGNTALPAATPQPEEYYTNAIKTDDGSISNDETGILVQQLKLLPPETGGVYSADMTCRLCTSIIYRPLIRTENL